jgi:hypothetical protein
MGVIALLWHTIAFPASYIIYGNALIVGVCRCCQLAFVIKKYFLDVFPEKPCDFDRQGKAGVVATGLN